MSLRPSKLLTRKSDFNAVLENDHAVAAMLRLVEFRTRESQSIVQLNRTIFRHFNHYAMELSLSVVRILRRCDRVLTSSDPEDRQRVRNYLRETFEQFPDGDNPPASYIFREISRYIRSQMGGHVHRLDPFASNCTPAHKPGPDRFPVVDWEQSKPLPRDAANRWTAYKVSEDRWFDVGLFDRTIAFDLFGLQEWD